MLQSKKQMKMSNFNLFYNISPVVYGLMFSLETFLNDAWHQLNDENAENVNFDAVDYDIENCVNTIENILSPEFFFDVYDEYDEERYDLSKYDFNETDDYSLYLDLSEKIEEIMSFDFGFDNPSNEYVGKVKSLVSDLIDLVNEITSFSISHIVPPEAEHKIKYDYDV